MSRTVMRLSPLFFVLAASGCSLLSAPELPKTRYFVLTSDRHQSLSEGTDSQPKISVGIGPFTFPAYLGRNQMVSRTETNQIVFNQFDRWAEPVSAGFLRVLSEDVGRAVGTNQVVLFPWYQIPLEYQVKGEILRFESNQSEGTAVLEGIWTIYRPSDKKYLLTREANLRQSVSTASPEEVAAALSGLVSELGQEIGRTLKQMHRSGQ